MKHYKGDGVVKKYFKLLLITSLFFSVLAGCSANKKGSSAAKEKIVVYSNSISNGRGDFLKEEAAKKGFKLELVDLGGNDIYNRLVAEKDAPVADVAFGMNQMNFSSLKNKGILKKYAPNWLDKVDKNLGDKDNYFAPLTEQRVFMIYNADKIKKGEAAKDWKDMYSDPQNKGKYIVPANLGGATTNAVVYTQLMNNLEKSKKLGVSDAGWKELSNYFKNGKTLSEGQTEVAALMNGDAKYAYTFLSNVPVVEKKLNVHLGIVNPSYGVPQTIEQVGILKKKNQKSSTKKFVNWLGSADLQGKWAKKFGTAPVNKDAESSMDPRVKEIMKETTPQKVDYDFVNNHLSKWVEHVELNILK